MTDSTGLDDNSFEKEDGIIELTDKVDGGSDNEDVDDLIELTHMAEEINSDEDDTVIELTDTTDVAETFDKPAQLDMDDEKIRESLSVDDVSPAQIQAALEQLIERKFGDTLETMMYKVMEEVLEREITKIRDRFQEELDKIGSA